MGEFAGADCIYWLARWPFERWRWHRCPAKTCIHRKTRCWCFFWALPSPSIRTCFRSNITHWTSFVCLCHRASTSSKTNCTNPPETRVIYVFIERRVMKIVSGSSALRGLSVIELSLLYKYSHKRAHFYIMNFWTVSGGINRNIYRMANDIVSRRNFDGRACHWHKYEITFCDCSEDFWVLIYAISYCTRTASAASAKPLTCKELYSQMHRKLLRSNQIFCNEHLASFTVYQLT